MIVAGNLAQEKAGYLYALPAEPAYNLYGVGFDESRALENELTLAPSSPDELPAALEGGFGLVWDGDSAETCSGVFGEYLPLQQLSQGVALSSIRLPAGGVETVSLVSFCA